MLLLNITGLGNWNLASIWARGRCVPCKRSVIFLTLGKLTSPNFLATLVAIGEFLVLAVIFPVIFLVGVIFLGDEVVFQTVVVFLLDDVACPGLEKFFLTLFLGLTILALSLA